MILGAARSGKFAIKNIWRNLWLSVITVFLLVLTTFSITLVISLSLVGQQLISAVQEKVDISLSFHEYVSEQDILETQSFLQKQVEVDQVIYVSKEDALEKFTADHADDQAILATLDEFDENILPSSLIVRATSIEQYPTIIRAFETSEFQELVKATDFTDSQPIIDRIDSYTTRAYQIGIAVSVIFIIISVIFIFNTIRITIYSHREEIGIMKLVGATNWFIRSPFVLEGMLLGAVASIVTLILFYFILLVSDPALTAFFVGYDFSVMTYFKLHAPQLIMAEFLGAIILSVISSMVAITRYLKV